MNKRNNLQPLALLFLLINTSFFVNATNPNDNTAKYFSEANGSSPYILWQWMNGCVTKEGISYDLEAFKRVGIKNVQQFLVGGSEADINDPEITVLGDKWMGLMRFSLDECQRLGMDFGTHNCPGWSSSGAPGLKVEESMQKLIWAKTSLSGSTSTTTPIAKAKVDTLWNYYKDICLIAIPNNEKIFSKDKIIVITDGLDKSDQLKNALPQGEWVVLRFGHTTNGKKNGTAPVSGQGLEVDKLSRKALDSFWNLYPEKLLAMAGEHAGKTFKRFEIDSYEAGNQDWTPDMTNEFMKRRGYTLYPWLAVIAGYTVESNDVTARFKYDWQRTINELFADNYYSYLNELINKVPGLEFLIEPYGTGSKNFDNLSIRGIGNMVMCEFWTKPTTWGWESILPVSSNAHVNGKKIVAAEAFTGQPQYAFQTDLAALKVSGDHAFTEGVNLFALHASAHQPWPQVKPGMTMGWWGTQFGPSQTWWNHGAAQWVQYVTRCQTILQKGLFVGDLCYLQLYTQKKTNIPQGYRADICNEKELLTRFSVKENKLILPDGMSYRILVLPNSCKIEPDLARKIEVLVNDGAIVVGNGFTGSAGLNNMATMNNEIRSISERLFGAIGANDAMAKNVRNVGKGKVYCSYSAQEALEMENISKDIEVLNNENDVAWIHRNDGNEHYYFIVNRSAKSKSIRISFRINGMQPEIWNPVTGQISDALVWETNNNRTSVVLNMEANGSNFVVFRNKSKSSSGKVKTLTLNNDSVNAYAQITPDNKLILNSKGVYKLTLQNGKTVIKEQINEPEQILLNDNWDVHFQENRGAPSSAHFEKLISWPLHADSAIKFFSGTAGYKKTFQLNSNQLKSNKRILIDLGEVKNVATITVNKKEVAVIWNPPFSADITDYCKSGENVLEIAVTNLWPNRIIGDKTQPDDCVWGAIRSFPPVPIGRNLQVVPDWVKNKTERPSKNRITFCTVDFFKKDTPLLPSGLIGPVQITVEDTWDIYGVQ
jgi:hypothetical protein